MTPRLRSSHALLFFFLLVIVGSVVFWAVYRSEEPFVTTSPAPVAAANSEATRWQVTPQPTWTRTPTRAPATPTQQLPTRTLTPTPLPVNRPTSVAVTVSSNPSSTLPIPTAVPPFSISPDAVTILLLGSDRRPTWENWRTDAIQYVVIHPAVPSAAILSIPRDLYVYIPSFWMSRINFADLYGETSLFEGGGFGLSNQSLLYNLGITADYYAKVDFDGLIGMVDLMGGIDVPVHCRLQDYWPYADESGVYHQIALDPGLHHMDGELALWYSRSRKTTSVFSRERRQQQVLEAMWRRARELDLLDAVPLLYGQTSELVETNLGLGNLLSLAVTAAKLDPVNIERYSIGRSEVQPYTTPYGGSVYLPIWSKIQPILADVLAPPPTNRATQDPVLVEVWNGTANPDWDRLAADRLYRNGFIPIITDPDRRDYTQSLLVSFDGSPKGSGLQWLQSLFGIRDQDVSVQQLPSAVAPLRLIIGNDYMACQQG